MQLAARVLPVKMGHMPAKEYEDFIQLVLHPALVLARGRITAANRRLSRITGYSESELLGMRSKDLFAASELSRDCEPSPRRSLAPGDHTGVLVKKDGQRIAAHLVARPLVQRGRSSGMLAIFDRTTDSDGICVPDTERLLEQCLQTAEVGVVVFGRNGLVAVANRKCCELLGYDECEMIGRHWADVFVGRRDRRWAKSLFDDVMSGKARPVDHYESSMHTKGGQQRTVALHNAAILRDHSGNIEGLTVSILDITEQKKVSKTLEDQDRLYKLVSENATAGVWTFDLATRKVTYMSPSISQITGFTGEEVTEMGLEQILTPASRTFGVSELERHLAEDREYQGRPHSWAIELEQLRKDGSTVWVEARTSVIRDAQGQATGIFGITRDITERKQAEKTLRESEKRYRTFFDNSMDATCIIGRNGKILDVNRAALALLGYSRDEMAKRSLADISPLEQRLEFQRQIEKSSFVRNFEMQLRRSDGVDLDCLLTFDLRTDDYGNIAGYEGSFRDITEWKRLQRNLRLYVNEVTRAQESERLRLSRELHDGILQDLLALGLGLEKAIRAEKGPERSQKAQLQHIRDEVERLAKDMRALSHALRPSVLDELGLVAAVQTMLRGMDETRGIRADLVVLGAERRLSGELELALFRIIQEALNNVKQHSEAESVRVQIDFGAKSVKAVVSDDGKGFESPRQLSDLASAGRLGLIGMEERARMLGGRVRLESKPNAGTSVMVEIPYVKSKPPEPAP
jgi:two-component system sensor histidine kinase DegS